MNTTTLNLYIVTFTGLYFRFVIDEWAEDAEEAIQRASVSLREFYLWDVAQVSSDITTDRTLRTRDQIEIPFHD